MIGTDQEPNAETLAKLKETLGEGNFTIDYEQTHIGVRAIIRTRDVPPREYTTTFAANLARESIDGVWQELADRAAKQQAHANRQEHAQAVGYRAAAQEDADASIARTAAQSRAEVDEPVPDAELDDEALIDKVASRHDAEGTPEDELEGDERDGRP